MDEEKGPTMSRLERVILQMSGEELRRMVTSEGVRFFDPSTSTPCDCPVCASRRAQEAKASQEPPLPLGVAIPPSYYEAREKVERWIVEAPDQKFDDIVGNEEALESIREAIEAPVKNKALYEAYGMKMPKGALLSGPPGCGKTMFARAAASEISRLYGSDAQFICVSGPELQTPYIGATEERIKSLFTFAKEYRSAFGQPLLIFIDEAETILPDRTGRTRKVFSWEESQVAAFLAEMDGVVESGAFVMLASNRPEQIDSALLRDGRCDFKIVVKKPTLAAVEEILRRGFDKLPLIGEDVTVSDLVFTAVESLTDPHLVIRNSRYIQLELEEKGIKVTGHEDRHFLMEHIISGAMAASIPQRSVRHAFRRDKKADTLTGVSNQDVTAAIRELYEENKPLDHSYYFNEFTQSVVQELTEKK